MDSQNSNLDSSLNEDNTITISTTSSAYQYSINNMHYNVPTYSGIGTAGSFLTSGGSNGTSWTTTSIGNGLSNPGSLQVTGDADFEGDIKWKGRSLGKMLEGIEDRLAILQPDPAKLEKFEALKKAYDHYKLLEKLIGED